MSLIVSTDEEINVNMIRYKKFNCPKELDILTVNEEHKPSIIIVETKLPIIIYEENKPIIMAIIVVYNPNYNILNGSLCTLSRNVYIVVKTYIDNETKNKVSELRLLKPLNENFNIIVKTNGDCY
jgi:hypothetical protein